MGGVEDDRAADGGEDRQGAHVGDQGVVAEGHSALASQDVGIAGRERLGDDVLHVPRGEELALLDVDRPTGAGGGDDEVGLATEEGGDLQDVDRLARRGALVDLVHIGEDRKPEPLTDFGEDRQGLGQAQSARGRGRGAVGLVEGGLVDEPDAKALGDLADHRGACADAERCPGTDRHGLSEMKNPLKRGIARRRSRARPAQARMDRGGLRCAEWGAVGMRHDEWQDALGLMRVA